MGVLNRLQALLEINTEKYLSQARDPSEMLETMLGQMEQAAAGAGAALMEQARYRRSLKERALENRGLEEQFRDDAELVLPSDEEAAREALSRAISYKEAAQRYEKAMADLDAFTATLQSSQEKLHQQIEGLRAKRQAFLGRERVAGAQLELNEARLGIHDLSGELARLEDRTLDAEARSLAAKELAELGSGDSAELRRLPPA